MYKQTLKSADDYLAKGQSLPQNASALGNQGARDFCNTQGALEVVVAAREDVEVAQGHSLTIGLVHAEDGEDFAPAGGAFTAEATDAALTWRAGQIVCRLAVPSTLKRRAALQLATTDPAASGALDGWLAYLAR
ncbi:hypothetical protein dsat_1777 [Alkalidesulfovibrio alkalitolerans DSM 16529]|jgi:hypothetical protein|uniref:Uncharacterized protein n=1 Tax=Alkalidesulfovibrio alkalitolerans DSM 16529 TaxID=1121439 RepID=S7UQE3_9BACT|nr:hypothetical protein [Alkalidesulfovibrio alkalitolerans]EPR36249.1 hypothetical protein dsat_1777 [Alkalidesulfovibrio alkalitolerans DSM 16529]